MDIKQVIDESPWTFGRCHLLFERLHPGDDPRSINRNRLDLLVQLHSMAPGFMSRRVVKDIGAYIESDANNFVGVWREYLRVRVFVNLNVPLKRRMKPRKWENEWFWVNFRYEGVPTFCFICGLTGHNEKFFERIFETPSECIEKPYGFTVESGTESKKSYYWFEMATTG